MATIEEGKHKVICLTLQRHGAGYLLGVCQACWRRGYCKIIDIANGIWCDVVVCSEFVEWQPKTNA
jgi:hypothetical protein